MEEYLNLYHQKLWEIAFSNVEKVFGVFFCNFASSINSSCLYFFKLLGQKKKTHFGSYLYSIFNVHSLYGCRVCL